VRHVVRESALLKNPLAVGSCKRSERHEQERNQYSLIHKLCLELH